MAIGIAAGTANAAGMIDLNGVLGFIGGERLGLIKPIQRSSQDQGIEMTVLGAVRDAGSAEIYVAMQDLTNEPTQRIDETLDVYDYFVQGGSANNVQKVDYDPQTGRAIVRFLANGRMQDRMTVRITSFLRGAHKQERYDPNLDLAALLTSQKPAPYVTLKRSEDIGGMGGPKLLQVKEQEEIRALPLNGTSISLPGINGIKISNVGFVDGKLHIQVKREGEMGKYNHGYLYFTDPKGGRDRIADYSFSYGRYDDEQGSWSGAYEEHVFDLSNIEQIRSLKLLGYFVDYDELVQGHWEVTFNLAAESRKLTGVIDLAAEGRTVKKIEVSPLGITWQGKGMESTQKRAEDLTSRLNLIVHFKDGKEIRAQNGFIQSSDGSLTWIAPQTLPLDQIDHVSLDGQRIQLK
ncbi:hypothetical protein [Saccharibacillus deserti]|uniref:hypothetical protein n=1 Tax=Saccharibacillus deserti TaxID=1634444 RepID=UPI00155661F5|nr:hypothetical protein [Saccharibacillus deserti]